MPELPRALPISFMFILTTALCCCYGQPCLADDDVQASGVRGLAQAERKASSEHGIQAWCVTLTTLALSPRSVQQAAHCHRPLGLGRPKGDEGLGSFPQHQQGSSCSSGICELCDLGNGAHQPSPSRSNKAFLTVPTSLRCRFSKVTYIRCLGCNK